MQLIAIVILAALFWNYPVLLWIPAVWFAIVVLTKWE